MTEDEIREFWNAHPCGDHQVAGLAGDYEDFFRRYDAFRYEREGHILHCLDAIDFKGKRVLEIGLGQGADSEQIIRRGGAWNGVDLTRESVERVATRLRLRALPHGALVQGSALALPFPDGSFDLVFSHGVLHHIPDIRRAQAEIARVLKPNGELVAMLYARRSINYLLSIALVRRVGLALLALSGVTPGGIYGQHLRNARAMGLWRYLKMQNFIHRNTDGPLNPYSKVYSLRQVTEDFANLTLVKAYQVFMYAPPLPVRGLPLANMLGWHLWVHMRPKKA